MNILFYVKIWFPLGFLYKKVSFQNLVRHEIMTHDKVQKWLV